MLNWCQCKQQKFTSICELLEFESRVEGLFFANAFHKFLWKGVSVALAIITSWVEQSGNGLGFGFSCFFLGFMVFSGVLWFWQFFGGTFCNVVAASRKVVALHGNVVLIIQWKTSILEENSIWSNPFGSTVDKWSFREIYAGINASWTSATWMDRLF